MKTAYRTHTAGQLRRADVGAEVVLAGWVNSVRDQGGVLFVDLRDRYGLTQVTFRVERDAALLEAARRVRPEWVVQAKGLVGKRPPEAVNPNLPTGEVEVEATALEVLSESRTPPFSPDDRTEAGAETRLKHRFIDLRRPRMSRNLAARSKIASAVRRHFESQGFLEVETPTLIRSTPEGSRDYLVPSRVHPGEFYALPQSPQLFKQLLMVGGQDRYFQIARCYRDEDLRADRQPEFTQVDVEASFVSEEDVYGLVEPLIAGLLEEWRGHEIARPFPRMAYDEAMRRYGSDKPDLRNPLEIREVTQEAGATGFRPFQEAAAGEGVVRALVAPGGGALSRKEIEGLEAEAKSLGAPGLAWFKAGAKPTGPIAKFVEAGGSALLAALAPAEGDLVLMAAGSPGLVAKVLGAVRLSVGRRLGLVDLTRSALLWVTDFPLVEWNDEEKRFDALHHPFTSPRPQDQAVIERWAETPYDDPAFDRGAVLGARARAYDIVLDGVEVGGGSIRIHRRDLQQRMFRLLGLGEEQIEKRFGWFVQALQYGTPPHGGIALGFDRLVALLLGETSIPEVIAFPKTLQATCLLSNAPAPVEARQLEELSIRIAEKVAKA